MAKTEQQAIDDYKRVESFLAEPAVKEAFAAVNDNIVARFKNANTQEEMQTAWALSKALDMLSGELMRTMANGQRALIERERREKQEEARVARQKR